MGSGASLHGKIDLSVVENLEDEFRKHGDVAVKRAWELTATQLSSDSDLEMHLCQLRRLAGTLVKTKKSSESEERRMWLKNQISLIDESLKSGTRRRKRSCFRDEMTPFAMKLKITSIEEVDEESFMSPKHINHEIRPISRGSISTNDGDTSSVCSDADSVSGLVLERERPGSDHRRKRTLAKVPSKVEESYEISVENEETPESGPYYANSTDWSVSGGLGERPEGK